jgi:uncharacterized protein YndB with AHSA1/START domain
MIDVVQQINAVQRRVGGRVIEAGQARTVIISQVYAAPVEDVWDACTNPERIPRWFLPVSGQLRLGGRYQLEGNAGGTIERCDPPQSFAATWEFGGDTSWIEVQLTAEPDGRTRLQIEHLALAGDERWAEFGPGAVGVGWDMALLGLAQHLSTGPSISPEDGAAWAASGEGRQFMSLSGDRWRDASISAGTGRADAQAAADRTLAAYTGQPGSTGADGASSAPQ